MSRTSRLARFSHLPALDPLLGLLPAGPAELWPSLGDVPEDFVLYGGTGLALRLGHRESKDFDFFSPEPFNPTEVLAELAWLGRVTINESSANSLVITTAREVRLAFYGGMRLQSVAEPSIVEENGVVVASIFDLAGTKAKTILDRSMRKDYFDIATLLRHEMTLPEIIGYAATIFAPLFEFPAAVFLRSLVWFGDGDADDLPDDMKRELEQAVRQAEREPIPLIEAYSPTIAPWSLRGSREGDAEADTKRRGTARLAG